MEFNKNDIVISGISGRFPKSNNIREFQFNLYNKIDMTDNDESRWKHCNEEVPNRSGKIRHLEKFDASFFSIMNKHANWTDPQMRILMEHSYESILDAGISPQSMIGTKTGVFVGCSFLDTKEEIIDYLKPRDGYVLFGVSQFSLANRISFALGLCGPSMVIDSACSSSASALDCAFHYMEAGICDSALVAGSQLIISPKSTVEYSRLGIVSPDGVCRPYDEDAAGFSRADGICVAFLQKRQDCKRIYANVIYSSSNNDGFKKEGYSFPSRSMQQKLMKDFYGKVKVDLLDVKYVEAHSTGTPKGDPEEVAAIDEVFCKKSGRSEKLVIGTVKSNMGHAEAASGMASLAKILLTFENQKIPPNINLKNLRSDVPAFAEGRITVPTEVQELKGNLIALNSFGLGGSNVHALFSGNSKIKINHGIPNDEQSRMVLWAGRTEAAVNEIFDDIAKRPLDAEHIALLQNSQIKTSSTNNFRGYGMFIHNEATNTAVCTKRNIQNFDGTQRPITFVYSGIGSQWVGMGRDLMKIPVFSKSINHCHNILLTKGIDLKKILTSTDEKTFYNVMNSYVGIVAIEIALTDVLKAIGIVPDYIIGHSVGELGCAYADGCFTAKETILAAHARGEASFENDKIPGAMAAVGMHWKELGEILPEDIDIACHNSEDSTTISGHVKSIENFIKKLSDTNVFVIEVPSSGIALHSRYISSMGKKLNEKLNSVIKELKARSNKWLSSTYPENFWSTEEARFSSAEYFTKNLLNPVLFQEVNCMIPKDALIIEVAPHGLLKSIIKSNLKNGVYVNLTKKGSNDGYETFMQGIGTIFQHGVDIDISKLYPSVDFPVSRGTPMISPIIKWNHEDDHMVTYWSSYRMYEKWNIVINLSDKKYSFIRGHIVDGRIIFPAAGWIYVIWETFSLMIGSKFNETKVIFEDIQFLRATPITKDKDTFITVTIQRGSGRFEIIEGNSPICFGCIKQVDEIEKSVIETKVNESDIISGDLFYTIFRVEGFTFLSPFNGVVEMHKDCLYGKIKWLNNWISFLDTILQFSVVKNQEDGVYIPTSIRKFIIDPLAHNEALMNERRNLIFEVSVCPYRNILQTDGIEVQGLIKQSIPRRRPREPLLEVNRFIPFFNDEVFTLTDAANILIQIGLGKRIMSKFHAIEIDSDDDELLSEFLAVALSRTPRLEANMTLITTKENISLKNVNISTEQPTQHGEVNLIIRRNCLEDIEFANQIKPNLSSHGFMVSKDSQEFYEVSHKDIQIVARIRTANEVLHVLQFKQDSKSFESIEITSNISDWLEPLKKSLKHGPTIIYAYNREPSGILGFFNCLRKEYPSSNLKCFFIIDTANTPTNFDINHKFFKSQLDFNFDINIFKDARWGSYRFLQLPTTYSQQQQLQHCYADCLFKGDLSTLSWMKGQLDVIEMREKLIKIKFSSLNFKDVMLALGRISAKSKNSQTSILGLEFSGIRHNGNRVMGFGLKAGALATHFNSDDAVLWNVPESWTLEEAATVPLVYFTVYFAFFNTTTIKSGKKILIHSGSGGVGQAAIQVALAYGLAVFTTVGDDEKKKFLLKKFSNLKPENIGNSRDTTFEKMVMDRTQGQGVDYVLNSLSDEKLHASIRCLGMDGEFLEIGKYDIMKGTSLDMRYLAKRITIRAVNFDDLSTESEITKLLANLIKNDIDSGVIQPLNYTIFEAQQVEEAFRFMSIGHHIGKVILKIRDNENDETSLPISVSNKLYCNSHDSVIVAGGLGGFGMCLVTWLASRGCKKIVIGSRNGIRSNDQRIQIDFIESKGIQIIVNTSDISSAAGCEDLIRQANKLGPVFAIFNLAAVLHDRIFENMTTSMFDETLTPKAIATKNFDIISRLHCPNLRHFVVFSSISCGRGSAGQSNYGMANSVMERIIEQRKQDGLPGKAIQWGAIGDVGMLAEMNKMDEEIGGTLPQPIHSCLESLDNLLTSDDCVVASTVVADKNVNESFKKVNIVDAILRILRFRDRKPISMDTTLIELGMDSLSGVEIQHLVDLEYDISLTIKELRTLTLNQIKQRADSKNIDNKVIGTNKQSLLARKADWFDLYLKEEFNSDNDSTYLTETILKVNDVDVKNVKILIIPGIYGFISKAYKNLCEVMNIPTYILQFHKVTDCTTIEEVFENLYSDILELFHDVDNFIIIGHSFGTLLAIKFAKLLEDTNKSGQVVLLDGSPQYIENVSNYMLSDITLEEQKEQIYMQLFNVSYKDINFENFVFKNEKMTKLSIEYLNRIKVMINMKSEYFTMLETTRISLIKPSIQLIQDQDDDLKLADYTKQKIDIETVDGDHVTMLNSPELPDVLRKIILYKDE